MSYSCYAYVLFGIKVPREAVVLQEAKRGCEHYPCYEEFCGKCGAPKWESPRIYVDGCDSSDEPEKWHGLDLIIYDDCALIGVQVTPFTPDGEISPAKDLSAGERARLDYELGAFPPTIAKYWLISTGG